MLGIAVTTSRPCPLCRSRAGRRAWHEDGIHYVRCSSCGAFFSDISHLDYEARRHNSWDETEQTEDTIGFYGDAREPSHRVFLERHPPAGERRLLDVGCGMGFFLERAAAAGWDVTGVEPSEAWAGLASGRVGADRVVHGMLEDAALDDRRFELITVWDVIEHVFEPLPFLERVRSLLAPGGRVFIRTPNLRYFWPVYAARRGIGHDVGLGPLNHVVYFAPDTMRRALAEAGLRADAWLALPPPQVDPFGQEPDRRFRRDSAAIRAKNAWAALADRLAGVSGGRLAVASDLDVVAVAST